MNRILRQAEQSFVEWRRTGVQERAARMKAAAGLLRTNPDAYARLMAQEMGKPLAQGATLLLGGKIPSHKGAYYPPTVPTNVRKGMSVYEDETFGPVAAIIPVKDEAEAIRVANDSSFGLGAAVFTSDQARGSESRPSNWQPACVS